jgi:DNA polymerase III gamma/tau subunit
MFIPKDYSEIFGQDHIINSLKSIQKNYSFEGSAIFFEGERGTGKTSLAHILANEFSSSKHNIKHINCGHTSTVAEMRELVNELTNSSLFGTHKTYILDEPQLLSYKAINELLIPIEDLPYRILFIMCSALPEKIEPMLLDRFTRYRTRALDNDTTKTFIKFICKREGLVLDKLKEALIVEKCDGNPRRIVKAIPKIKDVTDIKEVEYLLDISVIDEDEEVLKLFKLILTDVEWKVIAGVLGSLLKIKSPESIRMGMLNLIGSGLLKGFGYGKEKKLIEMFSTLTLAGGVPEKASLCHAIANIHFKQV